MDLTQCYLASKHHNYSYVSIFAILQLLQSQDPLIVCLEKKDKFLLGLLNILQQAAIETIGADSETESTSPHLYFNDEPLQIKCLDGRVYFNKASVFQISGLAEKVCRTFLVFNDMILIFSGEGVGLAGRPDWSADREGARS